MSYAYLFGGQMEDIINWIKILATGHQFYYIALVSLIPLFILMKKRRVKFLAPLIIITVLVLSPIFNKITTETVGYYWRMLWILPTIPLCAAFPCVIAEKIKEKFVGGKVALIGLFAVTFIFLGSFSYGYYFGLFEKPTNAASKLPKEAVEVSDYLLSLEENPRVVVAPEMKYDAIMDCWTVTGLQDYIRQYTGKIELLFGRVNYIFDMDSTEKMVFNKLMYEANGNLEAVAQTMLNYDYSYLVIKDNENNHNENFKRYGFEQLANISGYGIFMVSGNPTEKRDYNNLGQVTAVTYLDQYGNPRVENDGYSTINYKYDWNGFIIEELRTDQNGEGVTDGNGYAGWEREYDFKGRCKSERQLGEKGNPVITKDGYYEIRTKYGYRQVTTSYFDDCGKPFIIADGYSSAKFFYNKKKQCIKEQYFNPDGEMCVITEGYAEICREYDGYLCVCEKYFNENEEPIEQEAGYYGKSMEYDDNNKISVVRYLDSDGKETNRIDGYSHVCWVDNETTGSRDVLFFDALGEEVQIDGINLVNGVHYGTDGWTKWMTPNKNTVNSCFNIGKVNLGPHVEGDEYTCFVTIEFSDVSATQNEKFLFWTQGSVDGKWNVGNVWNPSLVKLEEAPEDGVYHYISKISVSEEMTHCSEFDLGFRCDYWTTGLFRIKDVMILRGDETKEWTPGL